MKKLLAACVTLKRDGEVVYGGKAFGELKVELYQEEEKKQRKQEENQQVIELERPPAREEENQADPEMLLKMLTGKMDGIGNLS